LVERLQEKRSCKTTDSSREADASRAVADLKFEFVRQESQSAVNLFKLNDMTDHDIDVSPAVI
jgi:hypothetical protein